MESLAGWGGATLYFHSYQFIFLFLPLALASLQLSKRFGQTGRLGAMIAASLLFYGLWDLRYLPLLAGSITINYALSRAIGSGRYSETQRKMLLRGGIALNLGALILFRYMPMAEGALPTIFAGFAAPLGILFFTLDQIGYLIDTARGQAFETGFLRYAAFASFFPRLLAGPLLRYGEILPQLSERRRLLRDDLVAGLTIFFFGLTKKALAAGSVAPFAIPLYAPQTAAHIDFFVAWTALLAFACQIYFDLSGYADMAIGIARCFGIRLPVNFDSPYKARNIVEFWRRWNITLTRYLGDYVYEPLGGARQNPARNVRNLMMTTVLAGLWYGPAWPLALWGALQGGYLALHRWWLVRSAQAASRAGWTASKWTTKAGPAITLAAVTVGWVLFRAPDFATAGHVFAAMIGLHGAALPQSWIAHSGLMRSFVHLFGIGVSGDGWQLLKGWSLIALLFAIMLGLPNTQQWLAYFRPVHDSIGETMAGIGKQLRFRWQMDTRSAAIFGVLMFLGLLSAASVHQSLHWRF